MHQLIPNDKQRPPSTPHTPHTPYVNSNVDHSANKNYKDDVSSSMNDGTNKGPFMLGPTPAQLGIAPLQRRQSTGLKFFLRYKIQICKKKQNF